MRGMHPADEVKSELPCTVILVGQRHGASLGKLHNARENEQSVEQALSAFHTATFKYTQ